MLDLPARSQSGAETPALAEAFARRARITAAAAPWRGFGLAGRVLAVTLTFVLLAMGLFYVTRLSSYRENWLHAKIASAQTAIEAFDAAGPVPPTEDLSRRILNSVGVKSITVLTPAGRRELALPDATPATAEVIVADDISYVEGVAATFRTLFRAPGTIVKVGSSAPPDEAAIELTFDETPLIEALWRVSRNFLNISLTIAAVVTCVLLAALVEHGAAAGAAPDVEHHRLRRESAGRLAGDRADGPAQRDRPGRDCARRHAALARA